MLLFCFVIIIIILIWFNYFGLFTFLFWDWFNFLLFWFWFANIYVAILVRFFLLKFSLYLFYIRIWSVYVFNQILFWLSFHSIFVCFCFDLNFVLGTPTWTSIQRAPVLSKEIPNLGLFSVCTKTNINKTQIKTKTNQNEMKTQPKQNLNKT